MGEEDSEPKGKTAKSPYVGFPWVLGGGQNLSNSGSSLLLLEVELVH